MTRIKSVPEKLRWYFTNLPAVSFALIVTVIICYKIRLERHFSDVTLCVQPHMVMTGQVSRLIKYVVHHKNVKHLLLSIVSLAVFGTTAERQAGSIRFFILMTLFAVLSASLTVFFSILLGFSSRYSSLMYNCPALGLMPALFSVIVLVFKSYPLKKTVIFFLMIPNMAMPWLLLIMSQFVLQDNTFISNLSGCIVGSLYLCTSRNILVLPNVLVKSIDGLFSKIFHFIPFIRYIPGASQELPEYDKEVAQSSKDVISQYQPFEVPDDCVIPIAENSVPQYKVDKLVQMGFQREESIVALTASSNDIDQAVSILSNNQVGTQAAVLSSDP